MTQTAEEYEDYLFERMHKAIKETPETINGSWGALISDMAENCTKVALDEYAASQPRMEWVKAKKVCYCGSLRFVEVFKQVEYQSVLKGDIALLPCCMFVDIEREHGVASDYKIKADELHKRKIDICDEVFILNVGGYIGDSTRSEIQYAESIGKPIKYLEPANNLNK